MRWDGTHICLHRRPAARISGKDPTSNKRRELPGSELDARYLLPVGAHIVAQEGDKMEPGDSDARHRVRAVYPLQDGRPNPHDILRVKGEEELVSW